MHILFAASTFPHPGYPFSAFIKVICEEMVRQGHEVTVIAPQSISSILLKGTRKIPVETYYETKTDGGKKVIRILRPYSITFRFTFLSRMTWWSKQCAFSRIVTNKGLSFDIIYAHFWSNAYNALPTAMKTGKPLFVASGEDKIVVQEVLSKKTIRELFDTVRGVVCVSNKNKKESMKAGLTTESKCIVLPNAINPNLFYKKDKNECRKVLGFPQEVFIIAYCGRFNKRKGVDRVSAAINLLDNSHIMSIFIGSGTGSEIVQPNCEGILFHGSLEQKEIVDYLNSADVFVLPSLAEGCSNSIVEAMACGLPIISSSLPFNDDICDESNSILVDPMNIEAIAGAIEKMTDVILRKHLSEGALKTAAGLKISDRIAKILDFINENR